MSGPRPLANIKIAKNAKKLSQWSASLALAARLVCNQSHISERHGADRQHDTDLIGLVEVVNWDAQCAAQAVENRRLGLKLNRPVALKRIDFRTGGAGISFHEFRRLLVAAQDVFQRPAAGFGVIN